MELGCALMEKLINPSDEELFHKENRNLQDLLAFHVITCFRYLFSRTMVESLREKPTRTLRKLEEERGERCATLAQKGRLGREFQGRELHGTYSPIAPLFMA